MEKKGDLLNQLAIISDLLEKINANVVGKIIIIELEKEHFDTVFNLVQKKYNRKMDIPDETFRISIGEVDIIFKTIKNLI